jgi:ribosomal protein L30E
MNKKDNELLQVVADLANLAPVANADGTQSELGALIEKARETIASIYNCSPRRAYYLIKAEVAL